MKVFVTGGSGFIGGHIIERLAKTHTVWAMARSDASTAKVRAFGAKPISCGLGAVKAEHLANVDVIVHCAAYVEEWGTRKDFWSINVEGTQQLLDAAQQAGVKRFIHMGTEAALFDGHDLVHVDESYPYPKKHRFLYSETKAAAEQAVLKAHHSGFSTLSLRPCLVWGPRDTTVLPAILRMVDEGSWMWLDGGQAKTSTVHIYNLTHAVELALTQGQGGEPYFIVDEGTQTMKSFVTALASTRGVQLPSRSAPSGLIRNIAAGVEGVWRLFGLKKTPPLTRFAISMMSSTRTINGAKARKELGYTPVIDFDTGIAQLKTPEDLAQAA